MLSPADRKFFIHLARAVAGLRSGQKCTDTRITTLEFNINALHTRMNKFEARSQPDGMKVHVGELLPGFPNTVAQAQMFNGSLRKLMKDFNVKTLRGELYLEP